MNNKYVMDWKRYAALARKTAAEGIVLLRNENMALPLKKGDRISVFGRSQLNYYKSGTGSGGMVHTKYTIGILDALKEEKDISLNQELLETYQRWEKENPFDQGAGWGQEPWSQKEMPLSGEQVIKASEGSDAAVVVLGRTAGEDKDSSNQKGSYLLSDLEEDMLKKVCAAFARVIVLLNVGGILDMKWVEIYQPSAVLYAWQGGMEGGHALADVLMGRVNPCGKLTDTIAGDIYDYPSTENFGGEYGDFYREDIYVGYRYFETFAKDKVLYPFGYGLSYTDFSVTVQKFLRKEDETNFSIRVENTGAFPGKEVVQIYVEPPQGQLGKPSRNLCAFAKTKVLEPGESQILKLEVSDSQIASYDDSGRTGYEFCYVLEEGTYHFYVGTDVRSAIPAGSFSVGETRLMAACTQAAAPMESFTRMRAERKDNSYMAGWESVPLRRQLVTERRKEEEILELPYAGNRGYLLKDVYEGNVTMEEFISQLAEEELCCMVRGEGMCSPKVTPGTAAAFGGVTDALKNYGIPCGCCADGPSGIRMDCGTEAFSIPNGTCIACTFNEKLIQELFEMVGLELRKNRIDTLLGPGMNIHRNPLNGRNFEYFSEDPYLTGKIAAAELRGMHKYGVTGTIKHFAANNQEYHRRKYNSQVSERALREVYLKGFEIAVKEGKAYSVMTTYGAVNGLWTAGNYELLTVILRKEWGFNGMVMTDWWAEINEEGKEASMGNTAAMVRAQNDIYMVVKDSASNSNKDNLQEALEKKELKRGHLQRCAMNICRMLLKTPAMERVAGKISKEEEEAYAQMPKEELPDFHISYCRVEKEAELDVRGVDTQKGSSAVWGISVAQPGFYKMKLKVKVDAGTVAQIPISVFVSGKLLGTITMNGTEGKWVEVSQDLGLLYSASDYIRLYFAQSGLEIESAAVSLTREISLEKQMG